MTCRILLVTPVGCVDDADDADTDRSLGEALVREGFAVERLCAGPTGPNATDSPEPEGELVARDASGRVVRVSRYIRRTVAGVEVTESRGAGGGTDGGDLGTSATLLALLDVALARVRFDLVAVRGEGRTVASTLGLARARGVATVLLTKRLTHFDAAWVADAHAVVVPTRFAATYVREAFGLRCTVLPPLVSRDREVVDPFPRNCVTFLDPTPENGVWVVARIAAELGRLRPDIRLRVVGQSETLEALDDSGFNWNAHGNITFAARTGPSHGRWESTRVCLLPSLGLESRTSVAIEAMLAGIPVIGSDRGGLAEHLGHAGLVLGLPDRLTPATRLLPTAEEVAPWVAAILRFWDDAAFADEQRGLAVAEGRRWDPETVARWYGRFFAEVCDFPRSAPRRSALPVGPDDRVAAFARGFAWPEELPRVDRSDADPGSQGEATDSTLAAVIPTDARLIVELGAKRGRTTRAIADHAPNAVVISVDPGLGRHEPHAQAPVGAMLPTPFATFLAECWEIRSRVIPVGMTNLEGLHAVVASGLEPDLVIVDAHSRYAAVNAELELAQHLFPGATLVGAAEAGEEGVGRAVAEFATRRGLVVKRVGPRGWRLAERLSSGTIATGPTTGRSSAVVLVPHLNGIERECEEALRSVEAEGVKVIRRAGCSAIDVARNLLISEALHDGYASMMFIDSDLGFDAGDVLRLLARPESVVGGVYVKKGERALASHFAEGVSELLFGLEAVGLYPMRYAATGFLRIKASVLRTMIERLNLPLCNTKWGRGVWPFFQPLIIADGSGGHHYLGEDWAFSHRLEEIAVTPLADTSIRLWHWGRYGFGWEDAGAAMTRFRSYGYRPGG